MPEPGPWERNLRALERADPELALRISRVPPQPGLDVVVSRSGQPVPRFALAGRRVPVHSTVDPVREAQRNVAAFPHGEYVLCMGLGGGYHLGPLLERPEIARLAVVESGPGVLRGLLACADMSVVLEDPRLRIVASERAEELVSFLLADYVPVVYRSFCTVTLRARAEADRPYFEAARDAVEQAIAAASRDYAVQTRFGRRWLRNTLANLVGMERRPRASPGDKGPSLLTLSAKLAAPRALVTGAGPSLEAQIPRIAELRPGSLLLATDASLAPLAAAGITPDAVLSIDCQHVAYHHFMGGLPASSLLVLDIASPPLLGRLSPSATFLSTLHPLSTYLVSRGLDLPYVDVSGGNVTHAAVSLADSLGAEEIRLFGVDLSYPQGKPYARGCFLYPALEEGSRRLAPLEGRVCGFVLSSPSTRRLATPVGSAYVTQTMASYRAHLERLAARVAARVIQEPGLGPPLELGQTAGRRPARKAAAVPASPGRSITTMLRAYAEELRALPLPGHAFPAYVRDLDRAGREVLATLLPVAAARQAALAYPDFAALLEDARATVLRALEWCLGGPPEGRSLPAA